MASPIELPSPTRHPSEKPCNSAPETRRASIGSSTSDMTWAPMGAVPGRRYSSVEQGLQSHDERRHKPLGNIYPTELGTGPIRSPVDDPDGGLPKASLAYHPWLPRSHPLPNAVWEHPATERFYHRPRDSRSESPIDHRQMDVPGAHHRDQLGRTRRLEHLLEIDHPRPIHAVFGDPGSRPGIGLDDPDRRPTG